MIPAPWYMNFVFVTCFWQYEPERDIILMPSIVTGPDSLRWTGCLSVRGH